jgi:AraC family transcriptional regulator
MSGMEHRFEILKEKRFVGRRLKMSFAENRTFELWRSFMPERKNILNSIGNELYSVQIYGINFDFKVFNPDEEFEKWATIEVSDINSIPDKMESLIIPEGFYAVFIHKGRASDGHKSFSYIFGEWLPESGYELDNRPHFEILGSKYKNDQPDSEEEIWIPLKKAVHQ